jgi:hypothetical protein
MNLVNRYDIPVDWETEIQVLTIRANRREAAGVLRTYRTKRELIERLIDRGDLSPPGCNCSHCLSDWDCCGNLTVSYRTVGRIKRGLKIVTHLSRNV